MKLTSALATIALCGLALSPAALGQDATRAYAAELAADAGSRESLLAGGGGAGYEKGRFQLYDDSKTNLLWIGGHFQMRYNANFRRDDSADGAHDEFTHGFQIRRTRLRMGGSIWDKNLTYFLHIDANRANGDWTLLDGYGQYKWDNGLAVRWGQFKLPFLREESIADAVTLAAETSVTHAIFTQGRSQGVQLEYTAEKFKVAGAFSDGLVTLNTDFDSPRESDYGLTGRVDWLFAGKDFKRFDDFTSFRSQDYTGDLGFAVHYQDGGETGGTLDRGSFSAVLDTQVEGPGWNFHAAGIFRNTQDDTGTDSVEFDDYGLVVQGGYFVSDQVELFARFDVVFADKDRAADASTDDTFHTLTVGTNYYISPESHAAKFTADVQYFFNPEGDLSLVSPSTSTGLLADAEDGQVQLRLQMQVMF